MCRLYWVLMFVSASLVMAGCSSEEAPAGKAPAPVKQENLSEEELHLRNLGEEFEQIKSYADGYPRQIEKILTQVASFTAQAAGTKFEAMAEKLAAEAQEKFGRDAETTFYKLREEAKQLISQGNPYGALDVLHGYPPEFVATEWQEKIEKMAAPIAQEAEADRKMDLLRDQVKALLEEKNPEGALQLISDYPGSMRTGRRLTQWEKLHNEVSVKVEVIMARKRKYDAVAWDVLFDGQDMNDWSPQAGEWKLRDKLVVGTYSGNSAGFAYCGSESSPWDNFILEVEFKLVSGDYLVIGVRGKNEGGRSIFDQIDFLPEAFPRGEFHAVSIEARGDTYLIRDKATNSVFSQQAKAGFTRGPISFFISPGAEVHIRKARIKHLE